MYPRVGEKRRIDDINLEDEEAIGSLCRMSGRPVSPKTAMEQEKRLRREIANSNERRRMQSINAGFASLKTLLPHHEGEKLSKAAILQQTADYIYSLEKEKASLLSQYCQIKRLLNQQHHSDAEGSPSGGDSPCDDRSTNASSPPGATSLTPPTQASPSPLESVVEELRKELMENRAYLDRERRARKNMEDHIKVLEAKLFLLRKEKNHSQSRTCPSSPLEIKDESGSPSHTPPPVILEEVETTELCEPLVEIATTHPTSEGKPEISSRINISGSSPNIISNSSPIRCTNNGQGEQQAFIAPPTTYVTVVPNTKALNKNLSSVLELRRVSEVDTTHVTAGTDTLYIVNPTNSCQNSPLDTICEAIRHLEGDNMFAPDEQHCIKEEVITEETFAVEDETLESHHSVPQKHHSTSVVSTYDSQLVQSPTTNPGSTITNSSITNSNAPTPIVYQSHVNHQLGSSLGHLTFHMIQPEPQEAPLELTTTHRSSGESHYVKELGFVDTNQISKEISLVQTTHVSSSSNSHTRGASTVPHNTRPGVIVVKQP